jgi:polyhydroxybutyrate depolymerase
VTVCAVVAGTAIVGGPSTTDAGSPARVVAKPSRGCAVTAVAPGAELIDTTSSGVARRYLRTVPHDYDGTQPFPVVVDLHGYLEGAELHEANSRLGAFGDVHGFVTITPEGLGPPPHFDVELDAPDVRFVEDLLDEVERTLCVDRRRVFVAGYSNGAFLSSTIACVLSDRIAAIAPVGGLTDPDGCKPERPVPIVTFHGTADEFVDYDGGLGPEAAAATAGDGTDRMLSDTSGGRVVARRAATPEVVAAWAERNRCRSRPATRTVADDVTRLTYRCPKRADVHLYTIDGGGHTWPGSEFSQQLEGALGSTTRSIDANAIMWDFFRGHPLPPKGRPA